MKIYKITKEFTGPLAKDFPIGAIVKMERFGETGCKFGRQEDADVSTVTGIVEFLNHAKPV